jgi:hypothetical protein
MALCILINIPSESTKEVEVSFSLAFKLWMSHGTYVDSKVEALGLSRSPLDPNHPVTLYCVATEYSVHSYCKQKHFQKSELELNEKPV